MPTKTNKRSDLLSLKEAANHFATSPHVRTVGRWVKIGVRRLDGGEDRIKLKAICEGMYFWTKIEWIEKCQKECAANIPPVKKANR